MRKRRANLRRRPARRANWGFTLFESLLAALLVGIAATAFGSALIAGLTQNQAAVQYVVATNLASAMMNEIVAKPFADPQTPSLLTLGPESGETVRSGFDNADDYHGLSESAGQLHGPDGQCLAAPSLALYSRSVTAAYVNLPGHDPQLPPAFLRVTVEVKYNGTPLVTLNRLISSQERR